jgi:hypothetical protein
MSHVTLVWEQHGLECRRAFSSRALACQWAERCLPEGIVWDVEGE